MRLRPITTLLAFILCLITLPVCASAQAGLRWSYAAFEQSMAITKKAMMADPAQALSSANHLRALAGRLPQDRKGQMAVATAEWLQGEALIFLNKAADAAPHIAAAQAAVERIAPNTKLHGDVLRSHGTLAAMTGRPLDALHDYQRAHDVFQRAGEARSRAITLQDIGLIYFDAGDYAHVLQYTRQAEEVFPRDAMLTMTLRNNRAEVFRKQKRYAQAAAEYRAALTFARKLDSPLLLARIYTNLASSEAEGKRLNSAKTAVEQAMQFAAHGKAAGWRPFVYGSAAEIAVAQYDYIRAARLLDLTFAGVDLEHSDMLFREYHQTAARVYEELGHPQRSLQHLKAFQRLDTEAQQLTASAASQLMAARFDFTNQNLKIAKLNQDRQARELEAEREKNRNRNLLFGGVSVAATFVFGVLLFAFITTRRSRDKVRDAYGSLSASNADLEKALAARTEFLATTSHEIRTPLNGILGMTQVLLADGQIVGRIRERIEVVHGAGETMKALVDDILDVAKIESGELHLVRELVDVKHILDDAARLWSGQAESKGLALVLDIASCPRRIMGDGSRLRQIIFNLMSNALKFTAEGGVTLLVNTDTGQDGGESLTIRISDTGIGIPLDRQRDIFETFKQIDGGTTRQYGGTGLGLAICLQLVRAMNGTIAVESRPGEGSSFIVTLPLEQAEAAQSTAISEADQDIKLAATRMLVLDPDPGSRTLLCIMLAAETDSVGIVDDLALATAAVMAGDATHLVIDTGGIAYDAMPSLRDMARAARDAGAHLTLLVSRSGTGISVVDAMTVGASQIVLKPIDIDDLIAAIRTLYTEEAECFVSPTLFGGVAA